MLGTAIEVVELLSIFVKNISTFYNIDGHKP